VAQTLETIRQAIARRVVLDMDKRRQERGIAAPGAAHRPVFRGSV
jgi:hypothetical protein